MKNTKIINRLIDFYLEGSELTQGEHNTVRSLKEEMQAINYTRCSTQLKLVYTSDFCKWLETGFDYYEKTSDFLNKKGYRMTFKELVSKYEQEQNKKALIV
jgi:hypothetical protein